MCACCLPRLVQLPAHFLGRLQYPWPGAVQPIRIDGMELPVAHGTQAWKGFPALQRLVARVARREDHLGIRSHDRFHTEPMMSVDDVGAAALAMAALPDGVNFYSAMVLPLGMPFLGRG